MTTSFTTELRQGSEPTWSRAVRHRFVRELHEGTITDEVMAGYLIQDHRFLDSFLVLLGAGVSSANTFAARLRLSQFVGEVAGDENTYFLRSFDALGVSEQARAAIPDTPATTGFLRLFREAADTRDYAAILAVLLVTEWLYLDWATGTQGARPENFVHAEWIGLHEGTDFDGFVAFLRSELDAAGPGSAERAKEFFDRAVQLELDFFDQSYEQPFVAASAEDAHSAGGKR